MMPYRCPFQHPIVEQGGGIILYRCPRMQVLAILIGADIHFSLLVVYPTHKSLKREWIYLCSQSQTLVIVTGFHHFWAMLKQNLMGGWDIGKRRAAHFMVAGKYKRERETLVKVQTLQKHARVTEFLWQDVTCPPPKKTYSATDSSMD